MKLDPAAGGRVRKGIRLAAALGTFVMLVKTPFSGELFGQNLSLLGTTRIGKKLCCIRHRRIYCCNTYLLLKLAMPSA